MAQSIAVIALCASAATADAADIDVTSAGIEAGKLVITGTTASPKAPVRLDGLPGAEFNVVSDAGRAFRFELVYLPSDCIVTLRTVPTPTSLGGPSDWVVADCGPSGVSPRGAWAAKTPYLANDLATSDGSTWRARRKSTGVRPAVGADWEEFAAKGEPGSAGSAKSAGGAADAAGSASPAAADASLARVAPDGAAGGDLTGTYPNPLIRDSAVTSAKIANLSITAAKIKPDSIGASRLVAGAVITTRLADGAVTGAKIADGAVTSADVLDDSLTASDLATGSVGSSEIATDAVQATEIADNSIDGGEIIDNSLTGSDIQDHTLGMVDINGTDRSGAISVSSIAADRCVTITGSVGGARPNDAAILTTNGPIPSGMLIYAQRALTDAVDIKVCNLSGATSAAISNLPVRVLTFH